MILKALKIIAVSIYAVCGGLLILFAIPRVGWKALDVATGSMTPAIPQGSLVFIHSVPPRDLKVGDVVTYINPANTKQTITHRIVKVTTKLHLPAFVTKGDANKASDPEILGGNVVGKVELHVPVAGKIIGYARKPIGLAILVIIPGILIIVDELRRLVNVLAEPAESAKPTHAEAKPEPKPVLQAAKTPVKAQGNTLDLRPSKPKNGVKNLLLIGLVIMVGVRTTYAAMNSSATLTGNTISTAIQTNHIVISVVAIGGTGNVCPELSTTNVTVLNSGAGSSVKVENDDKCRVEVDDDQTIHVINKSDNSSESGSVNANGNTETGDLTTGNSSSSSSDTTTVTLDDPAPSQQWFELHNPTTKAVSLAGWRVSDDSGISRTLPSVSVPAGGSVIIPASALAGGKIGNGLSGAGDQLIIKNAALVTVDGLSWGSDHAVLNPAVAAIPSGGSAMRINPDFDTDQASDWVVEGP